MSTCGDRRRSFGLAGAFRGLGVQDGDRIAILAMNSDRYSEYLLATPWANAALNPVNVRWSPAGIAYSFEDSQTTLLRLRRLIGCDITG